MKADVPSSANSSTSRSAERAFSVSMTVSGVRCFLTYLVFPLLLPVLNVAGWVGPGLGLAVGATALGCNMLSIRRFWRANHRYKWPIVTMNCCVIILLTVMMIDDLLQVL